MLETLAITFKPAAPPVKSASADVSAVQEGLGANDFQGHLQTAQKSLRSDSSQSQDEKVDASQGAATKAQDDSPQENDSSDSADAVTQTATTGKPRNAEAKERHDEGEEKQVRGHDDEDDHSDEAKKVDAVGVNAGAVVTQAVVQQPVAQQKTQEADDMTEETQHIGKGGGRAGKSRAGASDGKPVGKKDAGEDIKENDAAAEENAAEETSEPPAVLVKKVLTKGNEAAVPFPKVEAGKPKVEKSSAQTVARKPQEEDEENQGVQVGDDTVSTQLNKTAKRRGDEQTDNDGKGNDQSRDQGNGEMAAGGNAEPAGSVLVKLGPEASDTISTADKAAVKTATPEKAESPPATVAMGDTSKLKSADVAAKAQELPGGNGDGNRETTFEQIVMGLRGKLDARNGKAEIQLNPPNLGSLRVSVNFANGTLTAQFQSDNASVRDLLLSGMDKLKSVLQGQGLAVDKLAVSPQTNGSASSPQSVLPAQRFPDSANPDGRSGGNQGYSGQNQRQETPRDRSFASVWQEAREAPIDLVA